MNSTTPTLQSPSSSQPWQVPDKKLMGLVLQSSLQCLDRLDSFERHMCEEIREIRSHFRNILDSYQSNVTMTDSEGNGSIVDSQAGLDGRNAIPPFASSHNPCLPEKDLFLHGARRFADHVAPQYSMYSESFPAFCDPRASRSSSENLSLRDTSGSVHCEPTAQPLQGIYFKEYVPLNASARPDTQLPVPVVQASQAKDRVKCTRNGCLTLVKKDNLTHHINEVHEGKVKAVCPSCGQRFKRPNLMKEHVFRTGCGRF
ncbi:uncharacterized protein HD556DRAFT_1451424 [Suillus plorans]|uniref:C2H2-type domain-containing protein n=1 Tax=Suillus plorans TaxID=116603 RepID=A0A9P7A960_9AGAM|nr:uncharacterized protein HD556DRAFT_1451424 [Suillus plorans]KAG1784733.1 hypothetical protein HD556DRAFT_1451424 [Suillus plorans]